MSTSMIDLGDNNLAALYAEIIEHKWDCDVNRGRHFKAYEKNQKMENVFSFSQSIANIFIVVFLSVFLTVFNNEFVKWGIVCISALSLGASLIQQVYGYGSKAHQHWIAAQGYTHLYRQLQFFHNQYPSNSNAEAICSVVESLRNQLNSINLTSPHLPREKKKSYVNDKIPPQYNIEHYYKDLESKNEKDDFKVVRDAICKHLADISSHINIYLYGEHSQKHEFVHDYDIVIILQNAGIDYNSLSENLVLIRAELITNQSIYVDAYCYYAEDFYSASQDSFFINVKKGVLIHQGYTPTVSNTANDYSDKWLEKATAEMSNLQNLIDTENYSMAVLSIYYSYYYLFSHVLLQERVLWSSEVELIRKFIYYYVNAGKKVHGFNMISFLRVENHKNMAFYARSFEKERISLHIDKDKEFLMLFAKSIGAVEGRVR